MPRPLSAHVLVIEMLVAISVVASLAPFVRANEVGIGAFNSPEEVFTFEDGIDNDNLGGNGQISLYNNQVSPQNQSGSFGTPTLFNNYFGNISGSGSPTTPHAIATADGSGDIDVNFDSSLGVNRVGVYLSNPNANTTFTYSASGLTLPVGTIPQDGPFTQTINTAGDGIFAAIAADYPITEFNITWDNDESLVFDNLQYTVIPEPASLMLVGLGALLMCRRRH